MEVIVAKSAGFCFGVHRAVDQVYRQIEEGKKHIYTYGPIIHNEIVVKDLEARGVQVLHTREELARVKEGCVVIRSHGVPEVIQNQILEQGLELIDATCPFVKKIHRIASRTGDEGKILIIAGNRDHPEVQGICGWAHGPVYVVNSAEELRNLKLDKQEKAVLVAQTTFNFLKFEELVEIFKNLVYDTEVISTICNATEERQSEAREIAKQAEAMIVIGDRHSSNSQKLYEICKADCDQTYFVEQLIDLDSKPFHSFRRVGITAGASTPNKIIEEVQKHVRIKF